MLCDELESAEFDHAVYNSATVWPDNFTPSLEGAVFVES